MGLKTDNIHSFVDAREHVLSLLPDMPSWKTWKGHPAQGASPPWIVASFSEINTLGSESLRPNLHEGRLDIRVVSHTEESVGVACDKLISALFGAIPHWSMSSLRFERDSGIYAAELVSPLTGSPFLMRVITFRTGWSA